MEEECFQCCESVNCSVLGTQHLVFPQCTECGFISVVFSEREKIAVIPSQVQGKLHSVHNCNKPQLTWNISYYCCV